MRLIQLLTLSILFSNVAFGQSSFELGPVKAVFITSDIPNFWEAFDQIDSNKNPFKAYLEKGSLGLKDFIPYRIESPKNLLKTVKKRMADYKAIRQDSYKVELQTDRIREYYNAFTEIYDAAIFPPTFFVIGAFNSGGTSSENGLIIGVEMQSEIDNIPVIVAHELIHFNQNYSSKTLLEQSIKEGSADFVGELISGQHINEVAFNYFNRHETELCTEFVEIMNDANYHGWLYGSKGKKEGRPNDLGYAIGYKICESYYSKKENKREALKKILTISDFSEFIEASGYLTDYMNK